MSLEPTVRAPGALDVFIVAGETSGDILGGKLMAALTAELGGAVRYRGVGGAAMAAEGLRSRFPLEDVTAIGFAVVAMKLPTILRRLREIVGAIVSAPPDVLVLIDSPDLTHRIARRVRQALPALPIVKYVAPTVWVWRPGRAQALRPLVDHVVALFPFEPEIMGRLNGPPTSYVGHPVLERLEELRPSPAEAAARAAEPPLVLALPGSRRLEIRRLADVFGKAIGKIAAARGPVDLVLPTLPERETQIAEATSDWPVRPRIVSDDAGRFAAFRRARAAVAASGTVTLELALAGIPHVAAYRVPLFEEAIARALVTARSVILANLVLGENVVPEFLQRHCTAAKLAAGLLPLLDDTAERRRQVQAFGKLDTILGAGSEAASRRAARVVIDVYENKTGRRAPGR